MIIMIYHIITLQPTRCQQVMGGEMMMMSILVITVEFSSETCLIIVTDDAYDVRTSFRTHFENDDED